MSRRLPIIVMCVAAVALFAVAAARYRTLSVHARQNGAGRASSAATSNAAAIIRFVKDPQPVSAFAAKDLDGNSVSTADWPGKVTLVTFWATWCPPCRAEIPQLISLQKQYRDQLRVIGVSVDDSPAEEVKDFATKARINYPIVMVTKEIAARFGGVPALPTSFVINREGRVVQKHVGLYPPAVYDREIRALLGLPVDATIETFEDYGQIFLANAAHATELPGVDFSKLDPEQKKAALKRMNSESCTCGCNLTIAQCRINDTACEVSIGLAKKIVEDAARGAASSPAVHDPK
jgi:thiol-disulfide isomerase/thioredoxin